jgi:CRP-like cAMP-binding protein
MAPLEVLKACPLLKSFTDTGLQIVASIATERIFPKGAPLFAENMVADSMFVVASGTVGLSCKGTNGSETQVGELGPGDVAGELALLHPGIRLCTATARSSVLALELRHADFQKLLAQKPQACLKLALALVAHFSEKTMENRELLKKLTAEG